MIIANRRIGIIEMSFNFINHFPDVAKKITGSIIPIEIHQDGLAERLDITCICDKFDVKPDEQYPPKYDVIIRDDEVVEFKKRDRRKW